MAWYNFFNNKKTDNVMVQHIPDTYQTFSTPFGTIGKGNLALPYVRSYGSESFVRFGSDNIYPQLINQMYHQSPLNGSIINFKRNSVIGGGWDYISETTSGVEKVKEYSFIKRNNLKKLLYQATLDLIMHGRVTTIVTQTENSISFKRIGPEKVRNNKENTIFTTSDDWALSSNMKQYKAYKPGVLGESIFEYAPSKGEAGQEYYPIPQYCSALNSAYLNGEIPFLQKSNLINAIFPSFMLTMAKKFGSDTEAKQFKAQIENAKGPQEAGRILAFVANSVDQLPTLTAIPRNENDKLFTETIDNVQSSICTAHNIDMLIMGIRVPGKLGSGTEIPTAYAIYEKNVVLPLREQMEEFADELLLMGGLSGNIKIREYKIIDDVIVETKTNI